MERKNMTLHKIFIHDLYCYENQLTSIDVSNNTELTSFYCYETQITSLDVSKNTNLIIL